MIAELNENEKPACGTCPHYERTKQLNMGECFYEPPKMFMVPTPGPVAGTMVMQNICVCPPVKIDRPACSKHPDKVTKPVLVVLLEEKGCEQ